MAKNVKKNKNGVNMNIIIVVAIVAIVGILLAIMLPALIKNGSSKDQKKDTKEETVQATEKTVSEEYGFTKEDAINVIKKIYNSDNYTFEATIRSDNMYIVTVTNTETNESQKYLVDPNDGTFSLLDEE